MSGAGTASLVIPAYNERDRIAASLDAIALWRQARPGGWDWEVLLVDDGSADGTAQVARAAAGRAGLPLQIHSLPRNRGKGAAIRMGVLASRGDPILVSDADLSTPLSEVEKLATQLPTHSIAVGSRAIDADLVRKKQPLHRRAFGKVGNLLVRVFAVNSIRDTQCGFKLFRGDVARELFRDAKVERFAYDMEILHLAQRRGFTIAEVPVLWFNAPGSKVSVLRDTLPTLRDLLRIRWIHRRERPAAGSRS
ncbi:MAG: glycosyltransferase family 2 protein [Acidobacteriota bacterium]|nr:glycosyltransferase family 2 protein [Acidobacteriota bacterium]